MKYYNVYLLSYVQLFKIKYKIIILPLLVILYSEFSSFIFFRTLC
jgi:hypothetical protein